MAIDSLPSLRTALRASCMFCLMAGVAAVSAHAQAAYFGVPNALAVADTTSNKLRITATHAINNPGASAIAVNSDGSLVYMMLFGPRTVWDVTRGRIISGLTSSTEYAAWAGAFSPTAPRFYVAHPDGNVSVLNTANNQLLLNIPAGARSPRTLAVSPDGTRAYVSAGFYQPSAIVALDLASNTVITKIALDSTSASRWPAPSKILFTPDSAKAYALLPNNPVVVVIDVASSTATYIPLSNAPTDLAISSDGGTVYAAAAASIAVIDTASNSVTGSVPLPANSYAIALTPAGDRLYVGQLDNNVSVIDTATLSVVAAIPVIEPREIAASPDGANIYVLRYFYSIAPTSIVSVISTLTNTVTGMDVGAAPYSLTLAP